MSVFIDIQILFFLSNLVKLMGKILASDDSFKTS